MTPTTTDEQLASAEYRDVVLEQVKHASAADLERLADRAVLAAHVITTEFEKRFPAEYAMWNDFADEEIPNQGTTT